MSPAMILLLAAAAADPAATPQPWALPTEARKLRPSVHGGLDRAFLAAADGAPPYVPRTVHRSGQGQARK
jgi:hypothetical protein